MVWLKLGPPYVCKLLKPSNGKNLVEDRKNDKFVSKTYIFGITKCDKIFGLLVIDEQIIMPQGLKTPPLEQRKKKGFCKYHTLLGHKTYQCLFSDIWCIKLWKRADSNLARSQRHWWRWILTQCRLRILTMMGLWRFSCQSYWRIQHGGW